MLEFDADAPAAGCELFGLSGAIEASAVVVIPVPFDATASGRRGTAGNLDAVIAASEQVDLHDLDFGDPWTQGIALDRRGYQDVAAWNTQATTGVDELRAGPAAGGEGMLEAVNLAGDRVEAHVHQRVTAALRAGRLPIVLGGDHSVPLGAHRAALDRSGGPGAEPGTDPGTNPGGQLGFLHIDAHADMRDAYEGFTHSHASIIHNLVNGPTPPAAVVQVGVRDVGPAEWERTLAHPRVHSWSDSALAERAHRGQPWADTIAELLAPLPRSVWITMDIDGLDPALCPATGTPVPGGLTWREAVALLVGLVSSGRRILGCDLCEVGAADWDASVGARMLYKLIGAGLASRRPPAPEK